MNSQNNKEIQTYIFHTSTLALRPRIDHGGQSIQSQDLEGVKGVQSSVLKDGWVQDTWRDKLLKEKV